MEGFRLRPGGSAGLTEYEVIGPPAVPGRSGVIAWPTKVVIVVWGYMRPSGGSTGARTAIWIVAEVAPAAFDAVTL